MNIKIVQVIQEYSTVGGAETVAFELSHALSRANVPNAVLASRVDGVAAERTDVERIGALLGKIPTRGTFRYLGRLIVVPLFSVVATAAARRHADDIIISHGDCMSGDMMVIHAVNAASLAQKRKDGHWSWLFNPMHFVVTLRDHLTLRGLRFAIYVAVSRRVVDELVHYHQIPRERIRIIPNGIDLKRFAPKPDVRNAMRLKYGIPEGAKVLLFAGHEFGRKGLEYVIRSLEYLPDTVWILVVGSDDPGRYRQIMPQLNNRIVFAGSSKNMPDFYRSADAFVFPTNYETFSLVSMEALACGLPILATKVGGIEDYLQDGRNGYFITRDPKLIAEKVQATFADAAHYQMLSSAALETARAYSWDEIAQQYCALAREVAAVKFRRR